jgi:hypothetical protein
LRSGLFNAEEGIERVRESFDLFDTCALDGAKVQQGSVGWRHEGRIGDRTCAGSERPIEKCAEGRIFAEIRWLNFCEVAAKEEGVCLEADRPEPYWQLERVKPTPKARKVAQGESTKDVNLSKLWTKLSTRLCDGHVNVGVLGVHKPHSWRLALLKATVAQ